MIAHMGDSAALSVHQPEAAAAAPVATEAPPAKAVVSPLIRPPPLDPTAAAAAHVEALLRELRSTEEAFIRDLKTIVDVYLVPLRERKLLDAKELLSLFSNVESLLQAHQALFSLLPPVPRDGSMRESFNTGRLAQRVQLTTGAFIALAPFLSVHAVFAANYEEAALDALRRFESRAVIARFCHEAATSSLPLQVPTWMHIAAPMHTHPVYTPPMRSPLCGPCNSRSLQLRTARSLLPGRRF